MPVRFVTENALRQTMKRTLQEFQNYPNKAEAPTLAQKEIAKTLQGTLPSDKLTIKETKDKASVIQTDDTYTSSLKNNFQTQAAISDVVPSGTGFTIVSNEKGTRSGAKIETGYSAFAVGNEQSTGMGTQHADMSSTVMALASGGTAALVGSSVTKAAGGMLAEYTNKDKDATTQGVEKNYFYIAPEFGMEIKRNTTVGTTGVEAWGRYDASGLIISGKIDYGTGDRRDANGNKIIPPKAHLDANKLEFSDGKGNVTTLNKDGLYINDQPLQKVIASQGQITVLPVKTTADKWTKRTTGNQTYYEISVAFSQAMTTSIISAYLVKDNKAAGEYVAGHVTTEISPSDMIISAENGRIHLYRTDDPSKLSAGIVYVKIENPVFLTIAN